jgi:hypothetical protein
MDLTIIHQIKFQIPFLIQYNNLPIQWLNTYISGELTSEGVHFVLGLDQLPPQLSYFIGLLFFSCAVQGGSS